MTDTAARYSASYRVRFDEAGRDGCLRTSGLLRYTQDVAAQHSEALGYDRAWYAARGLTWLVRTAELEILAPIPYATVLTATTRVVGFRRVWSRRETTFDLAEGTTVASVRIDWVLLDERGNPARIPAELERVFETPSSLLQLGRVTPGEPPERATTGRIRVRPQELDPMDHVNNAAYADWLDEAVLRSAAAAGDAALVTEIPRRVRLEYAAAAAADEELETVCWPTNGGWSCLVRRTGQARAELLRGRIERG